MKFKKGSLKLKTKKDLAISQFVAPVMDTDAYPSLLLECCF